MNKVSRFFAGLTRISLGWIFLWSFMDKVWGFGFNTASSDAWLEGGSPAGDILLQVNPKSPLLNLTEGLIGEPWLDIFFMAGLLLIAVSLLLGVLLRIGGLLGAVFMVFIFLIAYPPTNNPFMTEHLIYASLMIFFATSSAGNWFGLGRWWSETKLVSKLPFLK